MEGSNFITRRPAHGRELIIECDQGKVLIWPTGYECWLATSNLRSHCLAFAIISPTRAALYHVDNRPAREDRGQMIYDFATELATFENWLKIFRTNNDHGIELYVARPNREIDLGHLGAAKVFVQTIKERSGLNVREILYAPMPQDKWATMEIYSDGKGSLPRVYVNAVAQVPAS